MKFKVFIVFFFMTMALSKSSAVTLEEVNSFFDQVLSTGLPNEVIAAGNAYYEMPSFSHNMQTRTSDGAVINTKVEYHSGNVTGLQQANRKGCEDPVWTSGNITAVCTMEFTKISVKYSVVFTKITGRERDIHVLQHPFGLSGLSTKEARVVITYSPHVGVAALKSLQLTNHGEPTIDYETDKEIDYEHLSEHFYNKAKKLFEEIFYGKFRLALARAIEGVSFTKNY